MEKSGIEFPWRGKVYGRVGSAAGEGGDEGDLVAVVDGGFPVGKFVVDDGADDVGGEGCLLYTSELGFLYGKTSCIIAAALEENGEGKLTSIDLESVRNHQNNPNILDNLKRSNLGAWVEPIFSKVSYTWELQGIIEQQTTHGICQPKYDFIFLDGAHLWERCV